MGGKSSIEIFVAGVLTGKFPDGKTVGCFFFSPFLSFISHTGTGSDFGAHQSLGRCKEEEVVTSESSHMQSSNS